MNSDNNMNGIDSFELDDNMDFGFDLQQGKICYQSFR